MKTSNFLLFFLSVIALTGCAIQSDPAASTGVRTRIGGDDYVITQLTASTWTATSTKVGTPLSKVAAHRNALLQAIEAQSGCKVSDSDFSRQGLQFDAQVECKGALKN